MTGFDEKKVLERFAAKLGAATCPYCANQEWEVQPDFVQLPQSSTLDGPHNNAVVPGIVAICTGCGHLALFSALRHGLDLQN